MIRTLKIPETGTHNMTAQLEALQVGGKIKAPVSKRNYIASLISGNLKYRYFGVRSWTTSINPSNADEIIISRTA